MSLKGEIAREKIIKATTQLIDLESEVNNISIRRISKLAGVSSNSINYYFRTKDNLIEESVRIRMERVMSKWFDLERKLTLDPVTKFRIYMQNLGEFMAKHPKVMQVNTMDIYFHRARNDSLSYFHEQITIPLLKAICSDRSEHQIRLVLTLMVDSIFTTILLCTHYPEKCPCDFFDTQSCEKYIDMLVDKTVLVLKSFDNEQEATGGVHAS